jgi:hypothetical protein
MSRNRGKKKPKLRDYSHIKLTPEESNAIRQLLIEREQQPITIAILGAVAVEHELDALLRRQFKRKDDDTWAELVANNGPLSSFYAKIVTGHAFSIYNDKLRDDLHIIRTIRNTFAHSRKLLDFDDALIIDELLTAHSMKPLHKRNLAKARSGEIARGFYVDLCFAVVLRFLKRQSRALSLSNKRMERRLAKLPFAKALGYGVSFDPNRQSLLGLLAQRSQAGQSGGPKPAVQLSPLGALIRGLPKSDGNGDTRSCLRARQRRQNRRNANLHLSLC